MSDITSFLGTRLDEAEAATRALLAESQRVSVALKEPRLLGKEIPGWGSWRAVEQMGTDRLADVEAKRRILDLHTPQRIGVFVDLSCPTCWHTTTDPTRREEHPCRTLRCLALPYATHPDYRQEWKP
jgi:hypothetical protein